MTTIINATTGGAGGIVQTADNSGIMQVQSNGTNLLPLAWCIFSGTATGTNAPISGYNVTSIVTNATGNFTINFTNALASTNYVFVGTASGTSNGYLQESVPPNRTTSSIQVASVTNANVAFSPVYVNVVIYG